MLGTITVPLVPIQLHVIPSHLPTSAQPGSSQAKALWQTISDQFKSALRNLASSAKIKEKASDALKFIVAFSWAIVIALVLFALFNVQPTSAVEIPTNVTIDNDPRVATISLLDSDGGTLQVWANDSRIFNCTGTVTDGDGFADMGAVNATIYGPTSNFSAANSAGLHYSNLTCLKFASAGNSSTYTCGFYVHHHTESGNWTCNVSVNDSYARISTNQTTNTVDIFKSISVPLQTIAFGAYAHNQDSGTTDKNVTVNNTGNVAFNVTLDAYKTSGVPNDNSSMSCVTGTLPVGSIVFATAAGVDALSKTALTNAPTTIPANVSQTAYGSIAPVPYTVYLGIVVPATGMSGKCAGFLDVSAS